MLQSNNSVVKYLRGRSLHGGSSHGSTRLVIQLTSRQLPAHIMSCSHDYRNETRLSRTCIICRMRHQTGLLPPPPTPFPDCESRVIHLLPANIVEPTISSSFEERFPMSHVLLKR